jgi:hypothetical protein
LSELDQKRPIAGRLLHEPRFTRDVELIDT